MLGAGLYAGKDDVRFSLQGIYVAEAGRLRARLALEQPQLQVLLPEQEEAKHTPDYRCRACCTFRLSVSLRRQVKCAASHIGSALGWHLHRCPACLAG